MDDWVTPQSVSADDWVTPGGGGHADDWVTPGAQAEMRSYESKSPLRDALASRLLDMGVPRTTVDGLMGGTGLGKQSNGLIDFPLVNAPFAANESQTAMAQGHPLDAALKVLPIVAPGEGAAAMSAGSAGRTISRLADAMRQRLTGPAIEEGAAAIPRSMPNLNPSPALDQQFSPDEIRQAFAGIKRTDPVPEGIAAKQPVQPSAQLPATNAVKPTFEGAPFDSDEVNALVDSHNYVREQNAREKPESLAGYIVRNGGIVNQGKEVSHLLGGFKSRPGMINNATGTKLDDAARAAWEAGYFPDHAERPTINEFLEKLHDDLHTGTVVRAGDEAYFDDKAVADQMAEELHDYGIRPNDFKSEQKLREYLRAYFPATPRAANPGSAQGAQGAQAAQAIDVPF